MAPDIKLQLLSACQRMVDERIRNSQQAMMHAQEAANSEEKSSAGDKYETGRAMAQIQRDQAAEQVAVALQLKEVLERIHPGQPESLLGRLVVTNRGNFYFAISLGKLTIDGLEFYAISLQSPLAKVLVKANIGETVMFQNQPYTIREIL